jgi:hypothetical protein
MDEGQVVVEGELAVRGMREEVSGDQLMQKVVFIYKRKFLKGNCHVIFVTEFLPIKHLRPSPMTLHWGYFFEFLTNFFRVYL